jgi:hypothetical protein
MTTWTKVKNKKWVTLSISDRTIIPLLAICAAVAGLFFAVLAGGPFARALFGVPVGFREHFTSSAAFRQALFVQTIMVGFAFLLFGVALGRKIPDTRFYWTVWAVNPVTVGVGFVIYKLTYESLPLPHDLEYYHIRNGAILLSDGSKDLNSALAQTFFVRWRKPKVPHPPRQRGAGGAFPLRRVRF